MARSVVVDSSFLVALLSRRDGHRAWATSQVPNLERPWLTCEAVISEAFHLLGDLGQPKLVEFLRRGVIAPTFDLGDELKSVLDLMNNYADVPMSLADACLVRMMEILANPVLLTTDGDFRLYRLHGRQVIPCLMP